MKKSIVAVALLLAGNGFWAQVQSIGTPLSWKEKLGVAKKSIEMPAVNNSEEATFEMNRRAASNLKDFRFGKEISVNIDVMSEAEVKTLPNGSVVRQLTIKSPGAFSINVIFDQFNLSKNATLYLFDGQKTEYIGAHTSLNNNVNNMMGTELIHSDVMVIELTEPKNEAGTSVLHLGTVVHGYLDLEAEMQKAIGSSGSCNYDVNCPIGAGWEQQRNSVGMMMNGGGFCTGSLINNTSGTIIPYFLSANHCGTTPGSWVFRFRWERTAANAICATSNNGNNNGPTTMNVNGGVLRANYTPSDFTLTELNSAPDPAWGVYYNGWNATDIPATSAVGIHHPAGDIKKISFENQALISTAFGGTPANSHWGVTGWDNGVTEGGSSGSPLFDQNHRVVGQLHGGASACGGSQLSDEYGKIYTSWLGGGTNPTQLKFWLDPNNTGATEIDGIDPAGPGATIDAGMQTPIGVTGTLCGASVSPTVTIRNAGSDPLTSAVVHYGYDGTINQTYNWSGSLTQNQSDVITLPTATLAGGAHTFQAYVSNPNASSDQNNLNDTLNGSFTVVANPFNANLALAMDTYGSEITWTITSTDGSVTYYSGGPYSDVNGGSSVSGTYCLAEGCYKFNIADAWGDGMTSSNSPNGHMELTNDNGDTLTSIAQADANFGSALALDFCIGAGSGAGLNTWANESWGMYPNPAKNNVTIAFGESKAVKTVSILSASGAVIATYTSSENQLKMDIDALANGVYFVKVSNEMGTSTKKLIIE